MLRITYCRREVDEDGSCQPYVKPSTLGGMGLFTKGKPCPIEYVLPLRMFILFGPRRHNISVLLAEAHPVCVLLLAYVHVCWLAGVVMQKVKTRQQLEECGLSLHRRE